MHLVFVYIEKFRNIERQQYLFDKSYEVELCEKEKSKYKIGISKKKDHFNIMKRNNVENISVGSLFLKSKYPIVSMCLHNFIPSCPICNSRLKKDKDFVLCEHIYPYDESFNYDGRFALDNINFIYGKKPQYSIHISENSAIKEKIRHSVETFKINELYKNHIDYVDEIISKAQIYGSSQFDEF